MIPLLLILSLSTQDPVTEIAVIGNIHVPEETIRFHTRELVGSVPTSDLLEDAFHRLWATGLFENLRFELEPATRRLLVVVEEKPLLERVVFTLEGFSEEELRAQLRERGFVLRRLAPFGEDDNIRLPRAIESIVGEGFRVETGLEPRPDHRAVLTIDVAREPAPRIASIRFTGNDALVRDDLLEAMRLRPSGLLAWLSRRDRLRDDILEGDLLRLRELYRSHGYARARVGPPAVGRAADGKVSIVIPIEEGERYELGEIEVLPGPLLTQDQTTRWLPAPGSVFDGEAIERAIARIEDHYHARGYPAVAVERQETISAGANRIALRLSVREGPFYRVGEIRFRGHVHHRDWTLRRYLDLIETERLDDTKIDSDVRSLMGLGNFRSVRPEVDLQTTPGRAQVTYHVDEIRPFEYLVGGGVNGTQGGTGTGQFLVRSLLGRGEQFRLDADAGNRFQNFAAGYRDPTALGHRLVLAVDFARADLTFPDETSEETYELAIGASGPSGRRWQFSAALRLARFTLGSELDTEVPFLSSFLGERFRTNRVGFALAFDGRDRVVFPTRGLAAQMVVELAGGPLGGDVGLARTRAQGSWTVPFERERRHLLVVSGRAEGVWPLGSTRDDGLPRFERLFLGSENDLRGFDIRGVGPRTGEVVVGGDRLWFATTEYHYVASRRVRLVGFFDLGNVHATDFEGIARPAVRYDAGGELQILVPVANVPFRAGYGVNLDPTEGEDRGRFHVSLALRF